MTFELPPTGGIKSRGEFGTVKLLRYITPAEYALMGAEFVFAAFVFYYLIEEIIEIKALRLEYFTAFWNCLDLFMIVVSKASKTDPAQSFRGHHDTLFTAFLAWMKLSLFIIFPKITAPDLTSNIPCSMNPVFFFSGIRRHSGIQRIPLLQGLRSPQVSLG